jgi:hypothetical protein
MTHYIRALGPEDINDVLELQHSIKKYAGASSDLKKKFTNYSFENYFLNDKEPRYFMYGFFIGDKLTATIGAIDSIEIPAWTLGKYMALPNKLNAAAELQTFLINWQESKKLFQYYTCHALNKFHAHNRHWNKLVPVRTRYKSYLEYLLEPGHLAGHEMIDHDILAYTPWPEPLVIHLRILLDEYRTKL